MTYQNLGRLLESYYARFNKKRYISPDPLELVLGYRSGADREVAALISSSLALGRVRCIVDNAGRVLDTLETAHGSPAETLKRISDNELRELFAGFRYRFFSSDDVIALLRGMKGVLRRFGTLEDCFLSGYNRADNTTLPALTGFVHRLYHEAGEKIKMIPDPERESACKRLHLFLRWMIRNDAVDPGVWTGVAPGVLVVPMDVHMHRISQTLGMTIRKQADAKTAIEVTAAFKQYRRDDPVRYDFCLTRTGIHPELQSFVF